MSGIVRAKKRRQARRKIPDKLALQAVYAGQTCIGFLLPRRDGVEAYDADDHLLGTFPDQKSAADAVCEAAAS
jgi:hypothetical protein